MFKCWKGGLILFVLDLIKKKIGTVRELLIINGKYYHGKCKCSIL